ncbi:hypothetical protein AKO1_002768 [Acrasis kona]|uniref:GH18 domain-containing protein n=1 Tax=Acrasis kona TaxID=1008807 RepID=A0AAW2YIG8_9EUKA
MRAVIIACLAIVAFATAAPNGFSNKEFAGYFQSWTAGWASDPAKHSIARMPPYVTIINIAFARWNLQYNKGQRTFGGTGIDFSSDFNTVAGAIKLYKEKTGGKVLLSVGGATYTDFKSANFKAAADIVEDLGIDGIDIDYEPAGGACSWATGGNSCPGDNDLVWLIENYRRALPSPKLLTAAGWSTGAFGYDRFPSDRYKANIKGANFGLFINPLKKVGQLLDAIFIMSYDASNDLPVTETLEAYRGLYKGALLIGVEVPPEAWGGHVLNMGEVENFINYGKQHNGQGIMLWSIQKQGNPSPTQVGQAVCRGLGLSGCDQQLPSN